MRNNSLLQDLLRFVRPPPNFTGNLADMYMNILDKQMEMESTGKLNLFNQNNSNELSSMLVDQFHGMIDNSSVSHADISDSQNNKHPETYLGINDLSNAGNLSFVGTEIDQYLTKTSQMPIKDTASMEEVVELEESEDDLILLENMELTPVTEPLVTETPVTDNMSNRNERVVAAEGSHDMRVMVEGEPSKVRKRRRSKAKPRPSEAENSGTIVARVPRSQPTHVLAERARRERFSKKMKSLKELIPGGSIKSTDRASTLDEVIKYVERLQKKYEFLTTKVDDETLFQCNLIDQICGIEQIGFVPVYQPVPMQFKKTDFPFILPASAHQILTSGQLDRQAFARQFAPERTSLTMPVSMPMPMPMQMPMLMPKPMPITIPLPLPMPQPQQAVQPLSSADDDLQKLVNQALHSG